MVNKTKKGFTIVELVIVIAVIAILAAVLIPTFSNLINKANESADTMLVKNLNTALSVDAEKHTTMSAALNAALVNGGYDVATITTKNKDTKILWDSKNDLFVYLKGTEVKYIPESTKTAGFEKAEDWELFEICKTMPEDLANQKYSIYLLDEEYTGAVEVTGIGFDAGKNTKIPSVTYNGDTAEQSVVIRTNGGILTINAAEDTVYHYGSAAEVIIEKVDSASYHLFGTVNTLTLKQGHVQVEANATIMNVIVDKATGAQVSIDNKGSITMVAGADSLNSANGIEEEAKVTANSSLTTEGGYVKLTASQNISNSVQITQPTILDLNGQTITIANGSSISLSSNMTIIDSSEAKSGKITEEFLSGSSLFLITDGGHLILNSGTLVAGSSYNTNKTSYRQIVDVNSGSTVTVNGGTIYNKFAGSNSTNDYTGTGIGLWGKDATVIINGGLIKSDYGFALSGNGIAQYGGTYIEINGGNIVSGTNSVALYHPQNGVLTINGGYIEGGTAIYLKSGILNIYGGTIKGIGAKVDFAHNGNGSDPTGDAIVIESCSYPGGNPVTHTIEGAVIESANGVSVVGYVYYKYTTAESSIPFIVVKSNFNFDIFSCVEQADKTYIVTKIN